MKKTEEMLRFEKDLNADEKLRGKLEDAIAALQASGECTSDGDIMEKAARSLGYSISAAELERMNAERQEASQEEMELAAGGGNYEKENQKRCGSDYYCDTLWDTVDMDEHGHNSFCITAWHCLTVMLHTETKNKEVACFKDYKCNIIYEDPI